MAPRKYETESAMRKEMNRRIREREREERDAFRAAVAARRPRNAKREVDPAVVLYRETVALWKEKGRDLNGTSGRCPLVAGERQRGPRTLLQAAS